ncbi:MAG: hypothetical protein ACUVQF_02170 [Fervidobacterium sp.]|uniref:hypothetical protein n=1 Tax=Fervidobacterium sp. TaxID=1871331 RepID=UPI00404A9AD6
MKRVFLVVTAVIAILFAFSACVPKPEEPGNGGTPAATSLEYFKSDREDALTYYKTGTWYFFQAGNYFTADPIIKADGTVVATRTSLECDEAPWGLKTYEAQLLRFYDKEKTNFTIKLWLKGNKDAEIKAYFGSEPYQDWAYNASQNIQVTDEGTEVTLQFTRDKDVDKWLKLSLEFAHVPDLVLQVKVLQENAE